MVVCSAHRYNAASDPWYPIPVYKVLRAVQSVVNIEGESSSISTNEKKYRIGTISVVGTYYVVEIQTYFDVVCAWLDLVGCAALSGTRRDWDLRGTHEPKKLGAPLADHDLCMLHCCCLVRIC